MQTFIILSFQLCCVMVKTLWLNLNVILHLLYAMMGARLCNGLSSEIYIPFDFQAETLYLLLACWYLYY